MILGRRVHTWFIRFLLPMFMETTWQRHFIENIWVLSRSMVSSSITRVGILLCAHPPKTLHALGTYVLDRLRAKNVESLSDDHEIQAELEHLSTTKID